MQFCKRTLQLAWCITYLKSCRIITVVLPYIFNVNCVLLFWQTLIVKVDGA